MVTVPFSKQEKASMVRGAGLGDAASEACGADPARLTSIKPGRGARHGITRNDLISRIGGSP